MVDVVVVVEVVDVVVDVVVVVEVVDVVVEVVDVVVLVVVEVVVVDVVEEVVVVVGGGSIGQARPALEARGYCWQMSSVATELATASSQVAISAVEESGAPQTPAMPRGQWLHHGGAEVHFARSFAALASAAEIFPAPLESGHGPE